MNEHVRVALVFCLCGWLAVAGAAAQAAGAGGGALDKDFEMLFGPEAAKVAATPDGRDDAAFAEKVLAVARTASPPAAIGRPGVSETPGAVPYSPGPVPGVNMTERLETDAAAMRLLAGKDASKAEKCRRWAPRQ